MISEQTEIHTAKDFSAHKKVIGKNAMWLFVGQIVGRTLRTAIIIYSARVLGVVSWGAFSYALSLATLLTVFSDLGLNAMLTREAARNPSTRKAYLSTTFFIKFVLLLAIGALFINASKFLISIEEAAALIPIMAAVFIFDSLKDLGVAIARALEKMEIEGKNIIVTNGFIAAFGFLFLYFQPTSISISLAYALGTFAGFAAITFSLRREIGEIFRHFDRRLVKKIIVSAVPVGLLGLMATIMINTDVFMIGWLRSVEEVGLYSAPQKIIQLLYLVPTLISASFFPIFIRSAPHHEKFRQNFETALGAIFLISVPLTIGSAVLAQPIINLFYGLEYVGAAQTFVILAMTLAIAFPSVLISNGIFAHDRQKDLFLYAIVGILGNLILDFTLIPIWGIEGAAAATLVTQLIISFYAWHKMKAVSYFSVMGKLGKIFTASVCMGVLSAAFNYLSFNVVLNVVISVGFYFLLLLALKDKSLEALVRIRRKD